MNTYVEESLATFRVSLTEALVESMENMMRSFSEPIGYSKKEKEHERSENTSISSVKRKLNFLSKNARSFCDELQESIDSKAIPSRVKQQLKRLNDYESDCVHSIEELLADVEQEDLIKEVLNEWDEFRSDISLISEKADDYLSTKAASLSTNDSVMQNITGVKLPLLQLPRFSGNVLEWSAFYDAFIASIDSRRKLSNMQKFTHLRTCLSGKAYHCIEGYSVTNDLAPNVWLHSSVGRASHWYSGGHGFESR